MGAPHEVARPLEHLARRRVPFADAQHEDAAREGDDHGGDESGQPSTQARRDGRDRPHPHVALGVGGEERLRTHGQANLVSTRRRLRTAWPMRCSFSMRAKRTCPSPPGPNPTPGEVATSASLTRNDENSSEPISR